MDGESRKAARAQWAVSIDRASTLPSDAEEDTAFWLQVPVNERAAMTWLLSVELFAIANLNHGVFDPETVTWIRSEDLHERRLPGAAFSVTRVNVRFLVIGAYAVGIHGRPRATKELDIWVEATTQTSCS
jgi:hypothetical protein